MDLYEDVAVDEPFEVMEADQASIAKIRNTEADLAAKFVTGLTRLRASDSELRDVLGRLITARRSRELVEESARSRARWPLALSQEALSVAAWTALAAASGVIGNLATDAIKNAFKRWSGRDLLPRRPYGMPRAETKALRTIAYFAIASRCHELGFGSPPDFEFIIGGNYSRRELGWICEILFNKPTSSGLRITEAKVFVPYKIDSASDIKVSIMAVKL